MAARRDSHCRSNVKRVTQRINEEAARDLLERVPRAHVAFVDGGRLDVVPAAFRFHEGRHWVGVPHNTHGLQMHSKVALTIDEGWYWFELRAVCIRGVVIPANQLPDGVVANLHWFEVIPGTVTAWDYGTLHEEDIDAAR